MNETLKSKNEAIQKALKSYSSLKDRYKDLNVRYETIKE